MGRRLVVLIVVTGLGLSVLATAAAPQVPTRHTVPLAGSAASQSVLGDEKAESLRALQWIESRLGHKLGVPVIVDLKLASLSGGRPRAFAVRLSQGNWQKVGADPMHGCLVELPAKFGLIKKPADLRNLRGRLAHEITHCFQYRTVGVRSTRRMITGARWLADGSADWVGHEYVGTRYKGSTRWQQYIENPETSLFARTYDGIGFFGHIAGRADAWKVIPAMWDEWRRFFNYPKPFLVAQKSTGSSQEAQDSFLQTWAMSYARRRDLGNDWEMVGPAIPGPGVKATPTNVSIGSGGRFTDTLDEASVKLVELNVAKGLVIRVSSIGFGAINWESKPRTEARFVRTTSRDYCIIECVCLLQDESLDPMILKVGARKALLAITGGADKGFVAIRALGSEVCVPGTTSTGGRDPCIYTVDEATGIIEGRVGGHHPVEDVEMQFFPKAPPIPKHVSPPKRGVKLGKGCLYLSSFGDALWLDRLIDKKGSPWDGMLWISYLGYPRDDVLNGRGPGLG